MMVREVDCTPEERKTLKAHSSVRPHILLLRLCKELHILLLPLCKGLHILLLPLCKGLHIFLLPLCKGHHISSLDCNSHPHPGYYITKS